MVNHQGKKHLETKVTENVSDLGTGQKPGNLTS